MNRLIAVLGPTAVGKTKISIALAQRLGTEIISGDSMLIYRGMDIGTAKPTTQERCGIKHHLIDILEPDEEYSVVDFQQQASIIIDRLNTQGKIPILAGGTGLYSKALLEGYQFHEIPSDEAYRTYLTEMALQQGNEQVHTLLATVDPLTARRLHVNDLRRIIRSLEIHHLTQIGKYVPAVEQRDLRPAELHYEAFVIGLTMNRSLLYDRINQRVELMITAGLVEEVTDLLATGLPVTAQSMQAIGYKEIADYLQGNMDLDKTVQTIKQATRNFAKRQLTWYRKMPYIHWFAVDEEYSDAQIVENIYQSIAEKFNLK
jgi:tRNA dimethylallyltransferase